MEGTPDHFEKLLEGPCLNHSFLVKHLYKDCGLMKRFLSRGFNTGEHGKDPKPTTDDAEGIDSGFPMLDGCLIIFRGPVAYDSSVARSSRAMRSIRLSWLSLPSFGG